MALKIKNKEKGSKNGTNMLIEYGWKFIYNLYNLSSKVVL
jgi:hypothetical protein